MKKLFSIVAVLSLVAAVSCNEKESPVTSDQPGTVTFLMNVKIPETIVSTRGDAASKPIIDHIYVATFGSQQFLNDYVKAIPVGSYATENETLYQMQVTLPATTGYRTVHVIANGPESLDYQTKDTDLLLNMTTTYDEDDVPQGAYWQYFVLEHGTADLNPTTGVWSPSNDAVDKFGSIVLLRNFARVTITNLVPDVFVLDGFHVFRTENEGSITVPTSPDGGEDYLSTTQYVSIPTASVEKPLNYISGFYNGYTPEGVGLHDPVATTDVTWTVPGTYQFVYESVKDLKSKNEPFIILQGHLKSEETVDEDGNPVIPTKYYKMELTDADGKEFPILRNLDYNIKIESVSPQILGASSPELAKTCNGNISTSVNSELSQMSDGYSTLAVLYTDKTYVNTDSNPMPVTFMYKYVPAIADGSSVTIETDRSEGKGHAIEGADGDDWYTVSPGTDGWMNVTFNILPSETYTDEAVTVFKITGKSKVTAGGELQSLFRYVTVHLLEMQDFINPKVTVAGVDKDSNVTINFTLPDKLPVSVFPLVISVKDTQKSLNPIGTDMPLVLDGNNAYHFEKSISWEEYQSSTTKAVTCNMRFIDAITSSTITIDSEYFNAQTATVTAAGTYNFSK